MQVESALSGLLPVLSEVIVVDNAIATIMNGQSGGYLESGDLKKKWIK